MFNNYHLFFFGTGGGGGGILTLLPDLGAMLGGGGGPSFLEDNPFDNGLSFIGIGGGGIIPLILVLGDLIGGGGGGFKLDFFLPPLSIDLNNSCHLGKFLMLLCIYLSRIQNAIRSD